MESFKISYSITDQFSKLVIDYLDKSDQLKPFINHFPTLDKFDLQISEKKKQQVNRKVLVEALKIQNTNISLSEQSKNNIENLLSEKTFSITTGHQLCIFTGPLYFIYKIISTLNLSQQLKERYPQNNFVPIFWMASEDHDLQEINQISLFSKFVKWNTNQFGAVGRMNLHGFDEVIEELKLVLGDNKNAKKIIRLFESAYLKHQNLADATRYLINILFGKYGLIILDGNDRKLKEQFVPIIKKDILEKGCANSIRDCSKRLAKYYKSQAFIRDINFFKLSETKRELIDREIREEEIVDNPEKFSPNVLMRPLYQESILPNLAYIGGGAEIAYWMQLKTTFHQERIVFPILVLRNSAMIITREQKQKIIGFGFKVEDFFLSEDQLKKEFVLSHTKPVISFENEKNELSKLFQKVSDKTIDVSLQESIKAQLQKQLNSFEKIEQKIIRFNKQKHETTLNQISKIKQQLFPNNSLQERNENFMSFYLKNGDNFIEILKNNLNPLDSNFVVLCL